MPKKKKKQAAPSSPAQQHPEKHHDKDEIDFPTVVWSLAILIVLVVIHRLIWGG